MKSKVKISFTDKYTGEFHEATKDYEADEKRTVELVNSGYLEPNEKPQEVSSEPKKKAVKNEHRTTK